MFHFHLFLSWPATGSGSVVRGHADRSVQLHPDQSEFRLVEMADVFIESDQSTVESVVEPRHHARRTHPIHQRTCSTQQRGSVQTFESSQIFWSFEIWVFVQWRIIFSTTDWILLIHFIEFNIWMLHIWMLHIWMLHIWILHIWMLHIWMLHNYMNIIYMNVTYF